MTHSRWHPSSMPCRKGLFALLIVSATSYALEQSQNAFLAVLRFSNRTGEARFNDFHLLLRKRFEYEILPPGIPAKAWDVPYEYITTIDPADTARFMFIIYGEFFLDTIKHEPAISFSIVNRNDGQKIQKRMLVSGMNVTEIAEIVVLKASDVFRRSLLGILSVTSQPPACEIVLDGAKSGVTPKEFALPSGWYDLEIRGHFFKPVRRRVEIAAGKSLSVSVQMQFRGYPTHWWLVAACGATAATAAAWAVEEYYHSTNAHQTYRSAQMLRLTLQHLAIIPWTGVAFCIFINNSIQKHVIGRQ